MVEKIISSELYDEFRIETGLILKVSKYNTEDREKKLITDAFNSRKYKKKVVGLRDIFQVKEDITLESGVELKKGTYFYKYWSSSIRIVTPAKDINDYHIEVTCLGGSISGQGNIVLDKMNKIAKVLEENYGIK
ncbi:MAG: hypothetical protein ACRDDY_17080 [Clostridium sp.]|uniref:hypothetical protein n=1 Tax=Clostridium sp. TaxID=1506 RepID=UPI003EE623D8